jgi:polyphosphate kinase
VRKIQRESEHALAGKRARIIIKVNSVAEPLLIQALYRASMAGVEIKLIVRGICSLRPGVPGISDHIEVRSIIGRFLEHSRVYYFENDDNPEIFASSADFLPRNMFRRVEVCFPIEQKKLADRMREDLEAILRDDVNSWILQPNGTYVRAISSAHPFEAQSSFLERLKR